MNLLIRHPLLKGVQSKEQQMTTKEMQDAEKIFEFVMDLDLKNGIDDDLRSVEAHVEITILLEKAVASGDTVAVKRLGCMLVEIGAMLHTVCDDQALRWSKK